ncbi:hypothetical protein D3C81_715840 [compost metagenome]
MAICGCGAVEPVLMYFMCSTRSRYRPGATQPMRRPGARVLENELHSRTRPSSSKDLIVRGRG